MSDCRILRDVVVVARLSPDDDRDAFELGLLAPPSFDLWVLALFTISRVELDDGFAR